MIQITYQLVCDTCTKFIEYKKENPEQFIVDILKDGWYIENGKHFCCKECKEKDLKMDNLGGFVCKKSFSDLLARALYDGCFLPIRQVANYAKENNQTIHQVISNPKAIIKIFDDREKNIEKYNKLFKELT